MYSAVQTKGTFKYSTGMFVKRLKCKDVRNDV